ncbi:MAG: HAD family phosphatase [bacterium]|jgi:putative hydrolase of the HAD superfamily|nr:HAD family phosphatase [candidate division KSB1 bacterium]MDH7560715.1 HAD family phosphatase [bacterium]
MIKTVFFDLGGVVVNVHFDLAVQRLAKFSPYEPAQIERLLLESPETKKYELGLTSTREYASWALQALQLRMEEEQFVRAFSDIFTPNQEVVRLITQLDGRLQVGAISNTNVAHYEWIARHIEAVAGMRPAVLSFREHLAKPDPAIFTTALARAGCAPAEALFIDDLEPNVLAARSVGMAAFLYPGRDALVGELRALGIAVP